MGKDSGDDRGLVLPPLAPLTREERSKIPIPSGLMPQLHKVCEGVAHYGWAKMDWPKNFSALHLAAQVGSEDAVRFLLKANAHAGLSQADYSGSKPLDIARKHGAKSELLELLDPVRYRFIELRVKADSVEQLVKFRCAPVQSQVEDICNAFRIRYDEQENFRMLTASSEGEVRVVRSVETLMSLREGFKVCIEKRSDIVKHRIDVLRSAMHSNAEEIPTALRHLSSVLQADEGCIQEFVDQKGLFSMLEACVSPKCPVEPAMACLCLLLQYGHPQDWLKDRWKEFGAQLFNRILAQLFPDELEDSGKLRQSSSPFSTLSVCLFLLLQTPEVPAATTMHHLLLGCNSTGGREFYSAIVAAVMQEDAAFFQATAGHAILCTLLTVASSEDEDGALYKAIWAEVVRLAGSEPEGLSSREERQAVFEKEVTMICMSSCAETFSGDQAAELNWLRKAYAQSVKERDKEKMDIETLQAELRSRQQALQSMVSFVKIDSAPLVEQVLGMIVQNGWEEMQWQNGYTILHHVCECSDDPSVVDLVASLATDLDSLTSDTQKRAIDFARENPNPGIAKVLDKHRRQVAQQGGHKTGGRSPKRKPPADAGDAKKDRQNGTVTESPEARLGAAMAAAKASAAKPSSDSSPKNGDKEGCVAIGGSLAKEQSKEATAAVDGKKNGSAIVPGGATSGNGQSAEPDKSQELTPAMAQAIAAFKSVAAKKARLQAQSFGVHPGATRWAADGKEKDLETLGINDLRRLLISSEAEREKLQKMVTDQSGGNTPAGRGAGGIGGPLDDKQLVEYFPLYKTYGSTALAEKLQKPVLAGGLALDKTSLTTAMSQLETLGRVIKTVEAAAKGANTEAVATDDDPAASPEAAQEGNAGAPSAGKGKAAPPAKGAAKGKKGPPAPAAQADAVSPPADEAATGGNAGPPAPSKGSKGPGPPAGKGKAVAAAPADSNEANSGETGLDGKVGGKGPKGPPAPGGKGPPAPPAGGGGKGPGPPASGGKGPPPPGGKGPAPPGGKGPGPPAAGGKGPAGPAAGGKGAAAGVKGKGKGKAGGGPVLTKPEIKPAAAMKSLQWTRLVFEEKLEKASEEERKQGVMKTIWDKVADAYDKAEGGWQGLVPVDEVLARFSKAAGIQKVEKTDTGEKSKKLKEYTIIPSERRLPYEVMATSLPPTDRLSKAIETMDDDFMSSQWMKDLQPFCPDAEQLEQLKGLQVKMEETPDIPMGKVEQYMWALGQVSACRMRLRCWDYVRSVSDQLDLFQEQLRAFDNMLDGFDNHEAIAALLSIVLCFGNFLNGENKRLCQADGFTIDAFAALEGVRDPKGKDIRQLIFKRFFESPFEGKAEKLLQDMSCGLQGVLQRQIAKSEDGGSDESLQRSIRICIEDLDSQIGKFKAEYEKMFKEFKDGRSFITDQADLFKMRMPAAFAAAEERILRLEEEVGSSKERFDKLLRLYCAKETMDKRLQQREADAAEKEAQSSGKKGAKPKGLTISTDWCFMWDELFVPKALIDRRDDNTKKNVLVPLFCKGKPIDVDGMKILWELSNPEEEAKEKAKAKQKSSGRRAMRLKA